jgi:hypothetical protein
MITGEQYLLRAARPLTSIRSEIDGRTTLFLFMTPASFWKVTRSLIARTFAKETPAHRLANACQVALSVIRYLEKPLIRPSRSGCITPIVAACQRIYNNCCDFSPRDGVIMIVLVVEPSFVLIKQKHHPQQTTNAWTGGGYGGQKQGRWSTRKSR